MGKARFFQPSWVGAGVSVMGLIVASILAEQHGNEDVLFAIAMVLGGLHIRNAPATFLAGPADTSVDTSDADPTLTSMMFLAVAAWLICRFLIH